MEERDLVRASIHIYTEWPISYLDDSDRRLKRA